MKTLTALHTFENGFQIWYFWKRRLRFVNFHKTFRKRWSHKSACVSHADRVRIQDGVHSCIELSVVSAFWSNITILNFQVSYMLNSYEVVMLYDNNNISFKKRLEFKRVNIPKWRRLWIRPGHASTPWDNVSAQVVTPEEWKDNFRMSRDPLIWLAEELKTYTCI